jgi:hypothetical protein
MERLGAEYTLDNREFVRGQIARGDKRSLEMTSRIHTVLHFHGAIFPPEPDVRTGPRAVSLEPSVYRREVLAFGVAMWAALSA